MINKKLIILFIFGLFTSNLISQTLRDTLILHSNDTISCRITYVNNYSIFLKYKKNKNKKKLSDKIIPRIRVKKMIVNTKGLTIMKEKIDENINDFRIKSKLNKKLDILLVDNIYSDELVQIGEKYYKNINNTGISTYNVERFAKKHNCKLVSISEDTLTNKFVVKLFDASMKYYEGILRKYEKRHIYILYNSQSKKIKCQEFDFNKIKYEICNNEYIELNMPQSDTIPKNEYYYIYPQDAVEKRTRYSV